MNMNLNPGALNERVTFQKQTATVDAYANHINVWEDYYSCAAYVSSYGGGTKGGHQETAAGTVNDHGELTVTVRWCSKAAAIDITGYRIFFRGSAYDILTVDPMNYQRVSLKFRCRKVAK